MTQPKPATNQTLPQTLSNALSHHERETAQIALASLSPNTRRAYAQHLAKLTNWLGTQTLTDDLLAGYLWHQHELGQSPASIRLAASAAAWLVRVTSIPSTHGERTRATLKRIGREGRTRGRGQSTGISWSDAERMIECALRHTNRLVGLRDAAMIAVASDALLRGSELLALQYRDYVRGVGERPSGTIALRFSKTDQEGEGQSRYIGASTVERIDAWLLAAKPVWPTQHLSLSRTPGPARKYIPLPLGEVDVGERGRAHVAQTSITPDSPLFFSTIRKPGLTLLSDTPPTFVTLGDRIRHWAKAADIPLGRISTHSLRVGSAQSLAERGAGVVEMQVAGGWKSPSMPGKYARNQLAKRGAVARLRYGEVMDSQPSE